MIDDRNKTELTRQVTSAALTYLDERGCKPLETEVPIQSGWVADVAGVIDPTETELIKLKLVRCKPPWKSSPEIRQAWEVTKDAAWQLMTVLVEVKTSRSDFVGDKKWKLPIPTNLAYIAAPATLKIADEEIPDGWGVLTYHEGQDCVRCRRVPKINQATVEQQRDVILSVAVRRDHDTRYERLRELQREIRARQNEDVSRTRSLKAMSAMAAIVNGEHGSIQGALDYHGVKGIPSYFMPELEKLWAIKRAEEQCEVAT